MKREALIDALEEAIRSEETATQTYLRHMQAVASRQPMESDVLRTFRETVEHLTRENKRHKTICEGLLARVSEDTRDDI